MVHRFIQEVILLINSMGRVQFIRGAIRLVEPILLVWVIRRMAIRRVTPTTAIHKVSPTMAIHIIHRDIHTPLIPQVDMSYPRGRRLTMGTWYHPVLTPWTLTNEVKDTVGLPSSVEVPPCTAAWDAACEAVTVFVAVIASAAVIVARVAAAEPINLMTSKSRTVPDPGFRLSFRPISTARPWVVPMMSIRWAVKATIVTEADGRIVVAAATRVVAALASLSAVVAVRAVERVPRRKRKTMALNLPLKSLFEKRIHRVRVLGKTFLELAHFWCPMRVSRKKELVRSRRGGK
jgi:hypothetical protein